jgi:hypothetical protein
MESFVVLLACDRSTYCMKHNYNPIKRQKLYSILIIKVLHYWIQLKLLLFVLIFHIIHLLTGYEGNITFIVPKVPTIVQVTPRTIVGTEGTIKVLLPEYQVYKCFIILNNCAIQNSKLYTPFWWISSLLY